MIFCRLNPLRIRWTKPRFQESVHVFKMLEGTIPSSVESRIIEFLSCLSAQQSFVLRVMSVIGTRGIESGLLEVCGVIYVTCRKRLLASDREITI